MTTERLRELLEERVADVSPVDASDVAWVRAQRVRRKRQVGIVAAGAAAVLAIAGTVAVLDDRKTTVSEPAGRPTSTPSAAAPTPPEPTATEQGPRAERAGTHHGAPLWWTPVAARDGELPPLEVPELPAELSMASESPVATPPARIDAVFGTEKQLYRLLSGSRLVSVDLSEHLGPVADEGGNVRSPLARDSLSPDGSKVFFVQQDGVEVWDLATNGWQHVPTDVTSAEQARWTPGGELWLPGQPARWPDPWPYDHQYTDVVLGDGVAAESDWMSEALTEAEASPGVPGRIGNPHLVVAGPVDDPQVLAMNADGRSVLCCPVVGWVGDDIVLFESHADRWRILAWRVGTLELYRVSQVVDIPRHGVYASYVDAFSPAGQ
jgi:hypothetical protein